MVYVNGIVYGSTIVVVDSELCGIAWVYDNAQVYDKAKVYGDAEVCGNAKVYGSAKVNYEVNKGTVNK